MPKYPPHINPDKKPPRTKYDDRWNGRWVYRIRCRTTKADKEIRIGDRSTTLSELWQAVEAIEAGNVQTFTTLSNAFQETKTWEELAPATQRDYKLCHVAIRDKETRSGKKLGSIPLEAWTPGAVRRYRDERAKVSKSRAKKEIAYLKRLFQWGFEYEYLPKNPAAGISTKGLSAPSDEPYVDDMHYLAMLYAAPLNVACMAHMAYLTGRRRVDILKLKRTDLTPEGIFFAESKTDKAVVVQWSPDLEQLVNLCRELAKGSMWLFPRRGSDTEHFTLSALSSAWGDVMRALEDRPPFLGFRRFTFKAIRAKHATDLEESGGDATDNLDHSSRGLTVRHYLKRPKKVVSLR